MWTMAGRRREQSGSGDTDARPVRGRWKRRLIKGAAWGAVAYAVWLVAACLVQRRLLFPRHMPSQAAHPGAGFPGLQKRWISTPQGKVEAWFVPAPRASKAHPAPAVILAHGNAELIDSQRQMVLGYRRLGISALLCEYRGYGRSGGSPSQRGITSDQVKCYDWLLARPEVDRHKIFFHGRSLGSGVVCALAAKRTPAALILQSPFTSIVDMMKWYLIPSFLVWDPFDNEAILKKMDRPVLLLHGTRDRVVPYRHSQTLHRVARQSTLSTYDCGHNDFPSTSSRFWNDIAAHLRRAGVLARRKKR
jgi:fermentation-respiration switch protein FrsA (DUF1100 family)